MTDSERTAIVAIAISHLRHETDAIETCWKLNRYQDVIKALLGDSDRDTVVGIVSETDHLPVGDLKGNWHPGFVQPKLAELTAYEVKVAPDVNSICERLVERATTVPSTEEDPL